MEGYSSGNECLFFKNLHDKYYTNAPTDTKTVLGSRVQGDEHLCAGARICGRVLRQIWGVGVRVEILGFRS